MKRILLTIICCVPLSGCSWFMTPAYTKTVALMPFVSSATQKSAGQEAADRLGMELLSKGYEVIDRSTATALVNETKFYNSGLSDEMRKTLQAHNIMSVFFGSVNEFSCEGKKSAAMTMGYGLTGNGEKSTRCTVSLTAKLADTANGRLLWGVNISDTAEGANLTATELMKSLIEKNNIAETVPEPVVLESKPKWMIFPW
jgi:hypothetical protein